MLERLTVKGFKSLVDVTAGLPRLAVFFGPNDAGKSNLLDAIQTLSRMSVAPTLPDVLGGPFPIRGRAFESFSFGEGGLPALLRQPSAHFTLEADISVGDELYRYRIQPSMSFNSGELIVKDEYLARLRPSGSVIGKPVIELTEGRFSIRREDRGRPREESPNRNRSILSDRSLSGNGYSRLDKIRDEFLAWTTYCFEPRHLMRQDESPMDVDDIGIHGERLVAFLYRLQATKPKRFEDLVRTLRTIAPSVEALEVALDERRGILDLMVRQEGVLCSGRTLSEGTLRLLALCAAAANPWRGSLLALEEPENGVHPRRLDLIARLLVSLSEQGRQVIVTSHSPLFVDAVLSIQRQESVEGIGLFKVRSSKGRTHVEPFDVTPILSDAEIAGALTPSSEDGLFQGLMLRGFLDEQS